MTAKQRERILPVRSGAVKLTLGVIGMFDDWSTVKLSHVARALESYQRTHRGPVNSDTLDWSGINLREALDDIRAEIERRESARFKAAQ